MATIIGESGAWKEILRYLKKWDITPDTPSDLKPLLDLAISKYQPLVDQKKLDIAQRIVDIENKISRLRNVKGILRKIVNRFAIRKLVKDIGNLCREERRHIEFLDTQIETLKSILQSQELAGSKAEIEVIQSLKNLPKEYIIINDVNLRARRYIHFNGKPLQSAQIDHLILCPFGVFVIETKRWSKEFVQAGEYHNPFQQVERASYLCYDILRRKFGKIHVRSIIASQGRLPPPPLESHVKVKRFDELISYILCFKEKEIDTEDIPIIKEYITYLFGK
jgi:hypothetical protein